MKKTRDTLWERDGSKCHYCGRELVHPDSPSVDGYGRTLKNYPTLDHKFCKASGGTSDLDNMVLACYDCGQKKGNQPYALFLETKSKTPKIKHLKKDRGLE